MVILSVTTFDNTNEDKKIISDDYKSLSVKFLIRVINE